MPEDESAAKCDCVKRKDGPKKDDAARERWKLLAKALSTSKRALKQTRPSVSVRRFDTFGLIVPETLENQLDRLDDCWLKYSAKVGERNLSVEICLLQQHVTASDLMGFNNTGNVCIWPSEEVLAWYLLPRVSLFAEKSVLELGGGMTCLAGVLLARYSQASSICLTDGNAQSVQNLRRIVERNSLTRTDVSQLDWKDYKRVGDKFDVILSADCLFFDETRPYLAGAVAHCLAPRGVALVMAPPRGGTLRAFMECAKARGLSCSLHPRYCDTVWTRHLQLMQTCPEYDQDLHYPVLLLLTKSEYWVSQKRKFCEYCKCSIADNKPSIQFHENGKKHKENVQKKLSEMQKKATKDAKEQKGLENQMKKMEEAAMKAYLKDIEANPDFTSQRIKETIEAAKNAPAPPPPEPSSSKSDKPTKKKSSTKKWMEAKTAEDYRYYWHIETGESIWEAPKEGFVSIEEQETLKNEPAEKPRIPAKSKIKKEKDISELNREIYGRGGCGGRESKTQPSGPISDFGPSPRPQHVLGGWTAVVKEEAEEHDFELPEAAPAAPSQPFFVAPLPEEKPKIFKERKAPATTSIADLSGATFKKRKFGGAARNARQRGGED